MAQSTKSAARNKSADAKPYPEFPLTAHPSGRWCKKLRGKQHYFGPLAEWERALEKYKREWPYLLQGKTAPADDPGDWLTVDDLLNQWLDAKLQRIDSNELRLKTWQEYRAACVRLKKHLKADTRVDTLTPADLEALRRQLAKGRGPVALSMDIRVCRMVLKYAYDAALIDRPVRLGPTFKQPARRVLRQYRQRNGKRMLEADEIRAVLVRAPQPMKSAILLGINGGLGNNDIACLPLKALELARGWLEYPRPKTAVERRIPLWPETVDSIREAIVARPESVEPHDRGLAFLTRGGRRWVEHSRGEKQTWKDALGLEFGKLLRLPRCPKCGALQDAGADVCSGCEWTPTADEPFGCIHREGLNYYALRHTFETVAGETGDQIAVDAIMGHLRDDMATLYREQISDARLQAVIAHVHAWLFDGEDAR